MAFTIKEVEHVAQLARLKLNETEKLVFTEQLNSIIEYVEKLNELPINGLEPLVHILPVYNVFRADEIRPGPPREEILANAPLAEGGQYKVPKIM